MGSINTSQSPTGSTSASPTFMGLPTEIRFNIYKHIFAPTSDQPFRRLNDMQDHHLPFDTAILQTSSTVHNEAMPEFYASHVFHYTLNSPNLPRQGSIKQSHLPLLKHISIDTSWHCNKSGDAVLANGLKTLLEDCTTLKTLTLHFLASLEYDISLEHHMNQASSDRATKTAPLLRKLQSRLDRLSIVTAGSTHSLAWLRAEIDKDTAAWVSERFSHWPRMTLSIREQLCLSGEGRRAAMVFGMSRLRNQFYVQSQEIFAFHIYRKDLVQKMRDGDELGPGDWTFK